MEVLIKYSSEIMNSTMKAIETTGTIDKQKRLILDESIPVSEKSRVRVIILLPEENDIDEREWLHAATTNPSFDFLKESEENIYTDTDGKPFHDER